MKSKSTMIDQMFIDHPNEIEPGTPILHTACPCCGAQLDIEAGDDEGEIAVVGTQQTKGSRVEQFSKAQIDFLRCIGVRVKYCGSSQAVFNDAADLANRRIRILTDGLNDLISKDGE
jgi:hypothetical protein